MYRAGAPAHDKYECVSASRENKRMELERRQLPCRSQRLGAAETAAYQRRPGEVGKLGRSGRGKVCAGQMKWCLHLQDVGVSGRLRPWFIPTLSTADPNIEEANAARCASLTPGARPLKPPHQ